MSAPTLEKILQAVNEKYGTSFEGWSQLPTTYEVGDTVPNWNAYEKINREFGIKIASHFSTSPVVLIGWLYNDIYHFYAIKERTAYGVSDTEGRIIAPIEMQEGVPEMLMEHMNTAGYNVSSIQPDVIQLQMGTILPNWNEFKVI